MSLVAWEAPLPAPAKLNLFLHVTGQRADGYHSLQTVFRLIDLADTLRFSPRTDGMVRLATPLPEVAEEAELTVRAARALLAHTGCARGVTIALEKHIPIGGGLGGGSSDAATTLIALNTLWKLNLDHATLAAIGLALGADVPFFLLGRNAFAEGIGEVLTPIELAPAWYLVLTPDVAVSTREIFASPELTRNTKATTITAFFAQQQPGLDRAEPPVNDLEPVVVRRYPQVAQSLAWLRHFGAARMSGSGSSVFCEFRTEREARRVFAQLPEGSSGVVAQGLSRHPLA